MAGFVSTLSLLLLGQVVITSSYKGSYTKPITAGLSTVPRRSHSRLSTKLFVVEHLVDCATNPGIAELYGTLANDFCLQPSSDSSTIFRGLGGLVEQAATIGFLVMSYFFFKRSANGISEWEDEDDDEMSYSDSSSGGALEKELRRCPQCNGRGKFEFDGNADSAPICDLCDGSGSIVRSVRAKTLGLPISSRQLWSDEDGGSNDDRQ